jgi:hypothetical protein
MRIFELMENLRSRDYPSAYRDAKNRRIRIPCKEPAESFYPQSSKLEAKPPRDFSFLLEALGYEHRGPV